MHEKLWPYKKSLALLSIPILWIIFTLLIVIVQYFAGSGNTEIPKEVILAVFIVSLIPLSMVIIDFFSSKGVVLDVKGIKVDFSAAAAKLDMQEYTIKLPDNIGIPSPLVSDSSPMNIITALKEATKYDSVLIDLKEGESWWVTRLFALSAGAKRAGSPKIIVFTVTKNHKPLSFLGWSKPDDILSTLLHNEEYSLRYQKAIQIAKQVIFYHDITPRPIGLPIDVIRYLDIPEYTQLGEAVTEQIIMDQMATMMGYANGSLEQPPDKLSLGRFNDLFTHCLYNDVIDLADTDDQQIRSLLNAKASHIALVSGGKYDSMLRKEDGLQLILRELYLQVKTSKHKTQAVSADYNTV